MSCFVHMFSYQLKQNRQAHSHNARPVSCQIGLRMCVCLLSDVPFLKCFKTSTVETQLFGMDLGQQLQMGVCVCMFLFSSKNVVGAP